MLIKNGILNLFLGSFLLFGLLLFLGCWLSPFTVNTPNALYFAYQYNCISNMSTRQYRSVPVKKDILNNLSILEPDKTLKALVAEAIVEYIRKKTFTVTNKTPNLRPLYDVTPRIAPMINDQHLALSI